MLNHEPHERHERWRWFGASGLCEGTPSDPRLRRALGCTPQGWSSAVAAYPSELGTYPLPWPRSDGLIWVEMACNLEREVEGTGTCRVSRTPVSKRGSAEQARLCSGDLRCAHGRRMPDGWTRQRPRTAVPKRQQDYHRGDSPFGGSWDSWLPSDLLQTEAWCGDTPGLFLLDAVPAVEREITVHTLFGSGPGRSPRPGCANPRNLRQKHFLPGQLMCQRPHMALEVTRNHGKMWASIE